ncbi:unnamed protein product, partial [Ectocarpus fasciculatus]
MHPSIHPQQESTPKKYLLHSVADPPSLSSSSRIHPSVHARKTRPSMAGRVVYHANSRNPKTVTTKSCIHTFSRRRAWTRWVIHARNVRTGETRQDSSRATPRELQQERYIHQRGT